MLGRARVGIAEIMDFRSASGFEWLLKKAPPIWLFRAKREFSNRHAISLTEDWAGLMNVTGILQHLHRGGIAR